jgi:SH3-like domain-containing protein
MQSDFVKFIYQMKLTMTKARMYRCISILFGLLLAAEAGAQDSADHKLGSVSNKPIPRFASLKANEVNSRVGPGGEYQIAWVFRRAGLPVEILDEFENWRQVRDSGGGTGWVSAALLSARRTAVVAPWLKESALLQLSSSRSSSSAVAQVEPGAIVDIAECDGGACRVYAGKQEGWIPQKSLWGVYPDETIK